MEIGICPVADIVEFSAATKAVAFNNKPDAEPLFCAIESIVTRLISARVSYDSVRMTTLESVGIVV